MAETKRCDWVSFSKYPEYLEYHDKEWGTPLHDDQLLFEFLVLEGMQAGLSWITILRKREDFRKAFDDFDPERVANYNSRKVASLLNDQGIIRNRLKINAAIQNAKGFLKIVDEFGSFDKYNWSFVPMGRPIRNKWVYQKQIPARTKESGMMSADLLKRGFKFVGSTICYAHMQATGMVNDHIVSCFRYNEV